MRDEKKWFYQKVIADQQGSELASVLEEYPDCEFYELCQKFVDVGLNSDKLKGDADKVTACFRYEDMDAARNATASFVHKYKLNNLNEFLSALKSSYFFAADSNDTRQKTATIMADSFAYGKFYSFSILPDDVFSEIVKDIVV